MTEQADRIADWVQTAAPRLGLPPESRPAVRLIGTGESYAAWSAVVEGADDLVVRIARRPVADLPRPMAEELAGLAHVPAGLGPRPILLKESPEPLGSPFMVTGFIDGRERTADRWDDALLAAHARQLASLHAAPFSAAGEITAAEGDRLPTLSLAKRCAESLDWWRRARPDVMDDPEVAPLVGSLEARIAAAEPAFARLRLFSLIHGDLVVPNILVDDSGTPRYVDWEWVEIGDPAQDLAYIGGTIAAPPWYAPMTTEQIDRFLDTYLAHAGDRGGPAADLRVRRDAFELFERFFSALHFRTQRDTDEDRRTGRYTRAVDLLTRGLRTALA